MTIIFGHLQPCLNFCKFAFAAILNHEFRRIETDFFPFNLLEIHSHDYPVLRKFSDRKLINIKKAFQAVLKDIHLLISGESPKGQFLNNLFQETSRVKRCVFVTLLLTSEVPEIFEGWTSIAQTSIPGTVVQSLFFKFFSHKIWLIHNKKYQRKFE